MYSEKVIQASIEKFAASEGWTPVRHTLEEVEEFKKDIDSIVTIKSNSKTSWIESIKPISEKRRKEICRWIQNEQVICTLDSGYWESRYVYVTSETGEIVKYKNRKAQDVFDSILANFEEQGIAAELLTLSARQSGISLKVVLKILHRMLFTPNHQALMASSNKLMSELMSKICDTVYDKSPFWLVPAKTKKNAFSNGSVNSFQSATQKAGIAQGYTPQSIFLQDVRDIPHPVQVIEEGLLRAVFSSAKTLMVLEGRAGKGSDWFSNAYQNAKKYWPQGKSRLFPVFIPWYVSSDIYPTKEWLNKFPVPPNWIPLENTKDHAEKAAEYVKNTSYLSEYLGNDWTMPLSQQWYWESMRRKSEVDHTLDHHFPVYFAANDDEALGIDEDFDMEDACENMLPDPTDMQTKIDSILRKETQG